MVKEKIKNLLTSDNPENVLLGLNLLEAEDINLYNFLSKCEFTSQNITDKIKKKYIEDAIEIYEKVIEPRKIFYGALVTLQPFGLKVIVCNYKIYMNRPMLFNEILITEIYIVVEWVNDIGVIESKEINSNFINK